LQDGEERNASAGSSPTWSAWATVEKSSPFSRSIKIVALRTNKSRRVGTALPLPGEKIPSILRYATDPAHCAGPVLTQQNTTTAGWTISVANFTAAPAPLPSAS
jgi:hypothetical protein